MADCLYFKVNFDKIVVDEGEMPLHRNDILLVDNTMGNENINYWTALKLDSYGNRMQRGIIPSIARLEAEFSTIRRSTGDDSEELKGSRRSLSSARRSFFRKKRHQRSNSRDSRDIVSYSEGSLNAESLNNVEGRISFCDRFMMSMQFIFRNKLYSCFITTQRNSHTSEEASCTFGTASRCFSQKIII